MTTNSPVTNIVNYTVDRFWFIRRNTTAAVSNSLVLGYSNALEGTLQANYTSGNMRMQRYSYSSTAGKWGWNDPTWFAGQSDAIVGNIVSVTGVANNYLGLASDSGYIWTIVNLSPNGPLPLELVNFNAKQIEKQVKVWWDVQSEVGISKYVVERTLDYNYMDQVAQQNPTGPSTALLHYDAVDEHPLTGLSYYRLKTIGSDGEELYSQFVPVNFDTKGLFKITNVSANVVAGHVLVEFIYDGADKYNFVITDIAGLAIVKGSSVATMGVNKIEIPARLANGIYFLSIQTQQKTLTEKFRY